MERVGWLAQESDSMQQPTSAWIQQEHAYFSLSPEQTELLLALGRGDDTMHFDASKRDALQAIVTAFLVASHPSAIESFAMSDPEPWERLFRHSKRPLLRLSSMQRRLNTLNSFSPSVGNCVMETNSLRLKEC